MQHLAIIADGNRRWAKERGLPIKVGYSQGLIVIENCCEWALKEKVKYLTFYCFSTENWCRSEAEISLLQEMGANYFDNQKKWYIFRNIRVKFIGRRENISEKLVKKMEEIEEKTSKCTGLTLTCCIDYGGRDEIVRAIAAGAATEEQINQLLSQNFPEPDAILRTGGHKRLSNFLLWQSAYSELFFLDCYFPDLDNNQLNQIKNDYSKIKRNQGG